MKFKNIEDSIGSSPKKIRHVRRKVWKTTDENKRLIAYKAPTGYIIHTKSLSYVDGKPLVDLEVIKWTPSDDDLTADDWEFV